jgi:hypothetical protein
MAGESIEVQNILGKPDLLATTIANDWVSWKADKSVFESRVAEVIQYVYATSTRETENGSNWDHSTHIPKMAHLYDTLKANYLEGLMPHKDWLNIQNETDITRDQKLKILAFLKTKHRLRDLRSVVEKLLDDWILCGNCFAAVSYVRETHLNPLSKAEELVYQGPEVRVISPFDIVFNPKASTFEKTPKIIRTVMTLGEIAREIEENPDVRYKADVLQEILDRRTAAMQYNIDDINKARQAQLDGFGSFGQYLQQDLVEFLHFYGDIYDKEKGELHKNSVVTVVDRDRVVRTEPLNTWSGRPNIFHAGWRTRPNNLWGQGPLDTLVGMQFRIDHLENARADAFDEMLYGDLVFLGDVEVREDENGQKIYLAPERGGVHRLAPDPTVLNADFQIKEYEQKMELFAGAPREAMGFRTAGEKTKFEVSVLANAAARLFQNKMTGFEINILERIVNAEIEESKLHLNGKDFAELQDPDNGTSAIVEISRDDLMFNGKVIPVGARNYARQAQQASDLLQFQQSALQDEAVKMHFPSKKLAQAWEKILGVEQFELYEEFGRIPEQLQAARLQHAAQQTISNETGQSDQTGATPPDQTAAAAIPGAGQ